MKAFREWFDLHFTQDSKLPQRVKDKLKNKRLDIFDCQSPYSWMRLVVATLLPSDKSNRRQSGLPQNRTAKTDHYRGGKTSGPSISQVLTKVLTEPKADKFEDIGIVEEKLREAHDFIERRQAKVAKKLLAWRDRQVGRWESVLREAERGEAELGEAELGAVRNGVATAGEKSSSLGE
jgi:hypothetical protein